MKAADIADERILSMLTPTSWVTRHTIMDALSEYPPKVVVAKLRSLEKRHLAAGCLSCGCWGWHTLGPNGEDWQLFPRTGFNEAFIVSAA